MSTPSVSHHQSWRDNFATTESLNSTSKRGRINYFHILELAVQYVSDSHEDIEHTAEQRHPVQQKFRRQIKQLFNNKQRKKENKKQYLERKRREAAQQADIEHKRSQLLLQHQGV